MNRKSVLWIAAGLTTLAAIGSYTAKPLWAQVKAALVQNVDEPGRNPYSSTVTFFNAPPCAPDGSGTTCALIFQPVPAGKRLVATTSHGCHFSEITG
jgi:hypothetical protein